MEHRPWLLTTSAVYLCLAALLLPFYRYETNPDGISYLTVAAQYASGHFRDALNLYWSPLFSLLIAPLLLVSIPPIIAGKIVAILAGLATLQAVWLLCRRMDIQGAFSAVALSLAGLMILGFAMRGGGGSDLLLVCFLLFYLGEVFPPNNRGWVCGALGGLAYLTKAYAFPFFLVHYSLTTALHWVEARDWPLRRKLLINFLTGLIVFGALAAPWIGLISAKYGKFTIGTTGDYNYRIGGPMSLSHPHYQYLIPPPSEGAVSSWHEPSPARVPAWSPLASSFNLRHQLRLMVFNIKEMIGHQRFTSVLIPTILVVYAAIGLSLAGAGNLARWFLPLITALIYPVPYLLVTVVDRYLWLVDLIYLLMGISALNYIFTHASLSRSARAFLLVLFCGSFAYAPLRNLQGLRNAGKRDHELSRTIAAKYGIQGRLASCGDFIDSLSLAYRLGLPYYGSTGKAADEEWVSGVHNPDYQRAKELVPPRSDSDIERQLNEYAIDYYLVWTDKSAPLPSFVQNLEDVTRGEMPELRIYRWRRP
jgi:hypothetical protein